MSFENNETYLLVCFLLPFIAVISSAVIKFANLRDLITVSVAAALFINMLNVLDIFRGGHNFYYNLIEILPGINIAFEIEPLGMIFAL
jgi:multicomponent Na+:H+ antiporter subunit D